MGADAEASALAQTEPNSDSHSNNNLRWRKHHSINDVHHPVGCCVVRCNNILQVLRTGADLDLATILDDMQVLAFHSWHTLEELEICGFHFRAKDVVGQDVRELCLVLRLQEAVNCASWKGSKALVGRCEDGERARR